MKKTLLIGALTVLLFTTGGKIAQAANYYVSPTGNDTANSGTSSSTPWQTINKINNINFLPGDNIYFQGGQSFSGKIYLDKNDVGTGTTSPITISSYGSGRATINGGAGTAFFAYNTAGIKINNINFIGNGAATNTADGVSFYMDLPNNTKLDGININNSDISGFGKTGLIIGSWNGKSGFKNISLTNIASHDNKKDGINIYGFNTINSVGYCHQNVYIGYSIAYNNGGDSSLTTTPTGSGIIMSNTDGGTIEYSSAYNNGFNNHSAAGPVGIWTYESNNVRIQYNESYNNRTQAGDGDGFDLDGGTTNSLMQYNYSHGNDGGGFMLVQFSGARPWSNNIVRYNISENDSRKTGYGVIHLFNGGSGLSSAQVYNNTIYLTPATTGAPSAVYLHNPSTNMKFYNNIFSTTGGVKLLNIVSGQTGLQFAGNNYYTNGGAFNITYGTTTYISLASFRTGTNQEKLNGINVGFNVNPLLTSPGTGGTIGNATLLGNLTAYKLTSTSTMVNQGLNLQTQFGITPGIRDFYNSTLPQGSAYDIGAHELKAPTSG